MKKLLLMFMISLFLVSIVNGQLEQTDKFETTPEPDTIDRRLSFFEKMFSYITPGAIIVSEPSGQIRDCDNFPTGGLHIFLKKYPQTKVIAVGVKCSENSLVRVYECKDGQSCNNLLKVAEAHKIGGVKPRFTQWNPNNYFAYKCYDCDGGTTPPTYSCDGRYVISNGNTVATCATDKKCWIGDTGGWACVDATQNGNDCLSKGSEYFCDYPSCRLDNSVKVDGDCSKTHSSSYVCCKKIEDTTSPCNVGGIEISRGTSKCVGGDKITCNQDKTISTQFGACNECLYNGVSHKINEKMCVGRHPYSEYAWTCQSRGNWNKELCEAGCDDGICNEGVCFDGQFKNERCLDDSTLLGEKCLGGQWESFQEKCGDEEQCEDGMCKYIKPPAQTCEELAGRCGWVATKKTEKDVGKLDCTLGQTCFVDTTKPTPPVTPPVTPSSQKCIKGIGSVCDIQQCSTFSCLGDDSGINDQCSTGWCVDTGNIGQGICGKAGLFSNGKTKSGYEPHPSCVGTAPKGLDLCKWTTWAPEWFGTQCATAWALVIGGLFALIILPNLLGGKKS